MSYIEDTDSAAKRSIFPDVLVLASWEVVALEESAESIACR